MNEPVVTLPRRMIPRWRNFATTASLRELEMSGQMQLKFEWVSGLADAKRAWSANPGNLTAGELLAAAIVELDWDSASESATYLLRNESTTPKFTRDIADRVIIACRAKGLLKPQATFQDTTTTFEPKIIGKLRRSLRDFHHDPIHWVELALAYAIIGKGKAARKAILAAIDLAPHDRFVLRSAARCFIHLGEPDSAFRILNGSPRTQRDPWLLAAQIAVADMLRQPSKVYKHAKSLFSSRDFSAFDRAELGAALASTELFSGNDKKARQLFKQSLVQPTENALAQALWARNHLKIDQVQNLLHLPRSFEANARAFVQTDRWDDAFKATCKWHDDEPFSSRPAMLGSYIAATAQEQFAVGEQIAKRGLIANPGDPVLINNIAFCQACQGKTDQAIEALKASSFLDLPAAQRISSIATQGLIFFRLGKPDDGRAKYLEAITLAEQADRIRDCAFAAMFLAREELRARTSQINVSIQAAKNFAERCENDSLIRLVRSKLEADIKGAATDTRFSSGNIHP